MNNIHTFHVDPEPNDESLPELHERYSSCITAVRQWCGVIDFHGLRATSDAYDVPLSNVIFESDGINGAITLSMKVKNQNVYGIAYRRGRGEVEPFNDENNEPWLQCAGFNEIPHALAAGFSSSYQVGDIEGTDLIGPVSIQHAVRNLWFGIDERKSFIRLVINILEAARITEIESSIQMAMQSNPYIDVEFTGRHKDLIKNWKNISKRVQFFYEKNILFRMNEPSLYDMTLEEARNVLGIMKYDVYEE